jgi:anaerobic selenocysteine-containing dehydrogenase
MINSERNLTLMPRAVAAPGESLEDWRIIARIACAMGYAEAFDYPDAEAVYEEIRRFWNPATGYDLRGIGYAELRERRASGRAPQGKARPQPAALPQRRPQPALLRDAKASAGAGLPTPAARRVSSPGPGCRRPSCRTTTTPWCSTPAACSTSGTP